jgi:hypothetical protein
MARKKSGKESSRQVSKVCLRLPAELATRLAVAAAMRHMSQGELATELMKPYLMSWRLPSTVGPAGQVGAGGSGGEECAA